jgi:DNA-binding CsgD family transcriptional regulator
MSRQGPSVPGYHSHRYTSVLSPREQEVLELVVTEAAANKDIARILGISEETVKRHLVNIMNKTGYGTRLELAVRTWQVRYAALKAEEITSGLA